MSKSTKTKPLNPLGPAVGVRNAWRKPGRRPDVHATAQRDVRRLMPALGRQLDVLAATPVDLLVTPDAAPKPPTTITLTTAGSSPERSPIDALDLARHLEAQHAVADDYAINPPKGAIGPQSVALWWLGARAGLAAAAQSVALLAARQPLPTADPARQVLRPQHTPQSEVLAQAVARALGTPAGPHTYRGLAVFEQYAPGHGEAKVTLTGLNTIEALLPLVRAALHAARDPQVTGHAAFLTPRSAA